LSQAKRYRRAKRIVAVTTNGTASSPAVQAPQRRLDGADWRDSQIRYLVHFDDGGSAVRYRSEPLTVGAELTDGGTVSRVERVEPPPNPNAFGHAWATRIGGS
jgi:hypothetical protein